MTTERWVINASPIILLAKVGQIELLTQQADELVVPKAVAKEILNSAITDPAHNVIQSGQLPIITPSTPPNALLAWDIGAGETAVLTYALNHVGWTAIIDDGLARKCGRSFGIPLKGTLAVVIRAKRYGFISSAKEIITQLKANDFRIKDAIVQKMLASVGETWP